MNLCAYDHSDTKETKNKQKGYTTQSRQYEREYNIIKNEGERIIGEMKMEFVYTKIVFNIS